MSKCQPIISVYQEWMFSFHLHEAIIHPLQPCMDTTKVFRHFNKERKLLFHRYRRQSAQYKNEHEKDDPSSDLNCCFFHILFYFVLQSENTKKIYFTPLIMFSNAVM